MQTLEIPGAIQKLRRTLGKSKAYFQQTFRTPLRDLAAFSATMMAAYRTLESGSVNVEQVVFTPKNLEALLERHSLPPSYGHDWTITAVGPEEIKALLEAAWSDWLDFYFTPVPRHYYVFADHDEYTTILAPTKGKLGRAVTALDEAGFARVNDFERGW